MEPYSLLKVLHVLSSTVLFGTGIGTAFQMWMAHRGGDVRAIAVVTRNVVIADWLFTTPAILIQPATGLAMVWLAGFDPLAPWLVLTYVLYGIAGACWLPVVFIQIRMRDLAEAAARDGQPLDARFHSLMRRWFWLGWPAFGALVVVFWLMVTKPPL